MTAATAARQPPDCRLAAVDRDCDYCRPPRSEAGGGGVSRGMADGHYSWLASVREATTAGDQPGKPRCLYFDIDEHRNEAGGFDRDAFEIQTKFLFDVLGPYLTECHSPLLSMRGERYWNSNTQREDVPDRLQLLSN